jgi:hypothetical protein
MRPIFAAEQTSGFSGISGIAHYNRNDVENANDD